MVPVKASAKILIGFGLAIAVMALVGVFTHVSHNQLKTMSNWIHHTDGVLRDIRSARRIVAESQSSVRAYILTADLSHVEQFDRLVSPAEERLLELKELVKDNPEQLARMQRILPLFRDALTELRTAIVTNRAGRHAEARDLLVQGESRPSVEKVRSLLDEMESAENVLLSDRVQSAQDWATTQRRILLLGALFGIFALGLGGAAAYRSSRRREMAEAEMERFFSNSADMFTILDLEGQFVRMNGVFEAVLGYPISEMRGKHLADFVHPDDMACPAWEAAKLGGAGKNVSFEHRLRRRDGNYRWISWRATPVLEERLIYAVARDVTDQKALIEENNLARQAAHSANAAKSQFLANMSHEIRTPMNGVIGMTQLLFDTPLNAEQTEYAESIHSSAQSLLSIINDILDFSKIEAGMMELEITPFNLDEVLYDIEKHFLFLASHKSIQFRIAPSELPYLVEGDSSRLRQILTNLIGNAIKFTPKGSVEVTADLSRSEGDRVHLKFSVKDTGIGITDVQQPRVFQAFSQADVSTSRHYGGTGLGLSICKQLVKLMGGEIGFTSVAGVGSEFWFELPFRRGGAVTTVRPPSRAFFSRQKLDGRVLIAEDNQINQKVIGRLLEKIGCRIHVVNNGLEALEALRLSTYDLVLMDCHMPQMDGYEATRLIRRGKVPAAQAVKIIAMTANAMEGDRERCLAVGMDDYVSKPLNELKLHGVLTKYLPAANEVLQPAAIDQSALDELAALEDVNGVDTLLDILDTYLETLPEKLRSISENLRQGNLQAAAQGAHYIKSSAKTLGALRFGAVCQEIEDLQDPAPTTRRIELIERLRFTADESTAELTELAHRRRSAKRNQ